MSKKHIILLLLAAIGFVPLKGFAESCLVGRFCPMINRPDGARVVYQNNKGFRARDYSSIFSNAEAAMKIETLRSDPLLNGMPGATYDGAKLRLAVLFDQTKTLLRSVIQNTKGLNPELKDVILQRVDSVSLKIQASAIDDGVGPNPAYLEWNHSVYVPSILGEMPDATIVSLLGHEIGHSFDFTNIPLGLVGSGKDWALVGPPQSGLNQKRLGAAFYKKIKICLVKVGVKENQLSEAFADLVASAGVGAHLKALPMQDRFNVAFESIVLDVAQACVATSDTDLIHYSSGVEIDSHPRKRFRIEKLLLGNPAIEAALSCDPGEMVRCSLD